MSRYVDLDKLSNALCGLRDYQNGNVHFLNGIKTAIEVADGLEDKNVEKVVHCGVCRHLQLSTCSNIARCAYFDCNVFYDGYCNFGERNMAIK